MKKYLSFILTIFSLIFLFTPLTSQAANVKNYDNLELKAEETISGNLYAISKDITIAGELEGDLIAISPNIVISGRINGDLIAIAENISITGEINGNVRVLAKNLVINGIVSRNLNFFSEDFIIAENGEIAWDILGVAMNNSILGLVKGNADILARDSDINGLIEGNLKLRGQDGAYLKIGPRAIIGGDLHYQNNIVLESDDRAKIVGLSYELATDESRGGSFFSWWQIMIYIIISGFIIALLLIRLIKPYLLKLRSRVLKKPWSSILYGIIFSLLTPLLIVLLSASIIGIPLAIIIVSILMLALLISPVVSAILLGSLVLKYFKSKQQKNLYLATLIGLPIIALLMSASLITHFIAILLSSFTIGLILININK